MAGVLREVVRRVRNRVDRYGRRIVSGERIGRPIDIERLACPLRYDVWVRAEFIHLLRSAWGAYEADLGGFLERPQARAYFTWYREVAVKRFHPTIYPHHQLVWRRFLGRVRETARLWRSISEDGYDASKPIRLASGRAIRNVNGKRVASTLFAGDGCHRIACLSLIGQTRLEPGQYEVEVRRRYQPLDNTAILCRELPLDRPAYLRFLSRFYCGAAEDSLAEIRRRVAAERPGLLPELESVLAYDLARV
ncbi:MAG TPA: hypothetical protein VFZ26_15350 [Gemmatimonadales bacterium]